MDIRIEGVVIERRTNGCIFSFTIKSGNNTYKLLDCYLGNTERQIFEEGIECYSGNIIITDGGVIKDISATLWIKPSNECVCIYQQ